MFATYLLNIRRLLTQSIRHRPNLQVKSEHHRIMAEYSLSVREKFSQKCIFFRKGRQSEILPVLNIQMYMYEDIYHHTLHTRPPITPNYTPGHISPLHYTLGHIYPYITHRPHIIPTLHNRPHITPTLHTRPHITPTF